MTPIQGNPGEIHELARYEVRPGVGTAMVRAAETWARAAGCPEMASDTDPRNDVGRAAHLVWGSRKSDRRAAS